MCEKRDKKINRLLIKSKRSQVTLFIIIAVLIIAAAAIIYFLYPKLGIGNVISADTPQAYIQKCMGESFEDNVEKISVQGGSMNPVNYIAYNGDNIEYLCYSSSDYEKCVMQKPLLVQSTGLEIKNSIKENVNLCFNNLEENYKSKGYEVSLTRKDYSLEFLPKRIEVVFDYALTLNKGGNSEKYDKLTISVNNNLYELLGITNSILNSEASYGDAETTVYMTYYPWLKVEKKLQTDGTRVYILTNRNEGNKFQFASRSIALPGGYGIEE